MVSSSINITALQKHKNNMLNSNKLCKTYNASYHILYTLFWDGEFLEFFFQHQPPRNVDYVPTIFHFFVFMVKKIFQKCRLSKKKNPMKGYSYHYIKGYISSFWVFSQVQNWFLILNQQWIRSEEGSSKATPVFELVKLLSQVCPWRHVARN